MLPGIPHADGECVTCGNPTLLVNVPHPVDGLLPMPGLPEGAIACCLEDCPALYKPAGIKSYKRHHR